MDPKIIIGIAALLLALISIGVFVYHFLMPRGGSNLRSLMQSSRLQDSKPSEIRRKLENDTSGKEFEKLKRGLETSTKKEPKLTLQEKFFQAGMFSPESQRDFSRLRIIVPVILTPALGYAGYAALGGVFALVGAVFGLLLGLQAPMSILDRRILKQAEDIMFYLPLVIEQVSIGVSSSLDIGPCLSRIVQMADERDTHNAVTELLRHAQFHVKSGVSLEEALMEVGKRSGHTELKHTFMSLSQVAKHGGEISRQLQELADAVAGQRETKIDAKIKKLELQATAPVALVFMGFILILLIGFGIQIQGAFG